MFAPNNRRTPDGTCNCESGARLSGLWSANARPLSYASDANVLGSGYNEEVIQPEILRNHHSQRFSQIYKHHSAIQRNKITS